MSVSAELSDVALPISESAPTRKRPLLPRKDPFYKATPEFAAYAPGTIIRTRPITVAAFGRIPQKLQAWQVLYRTTDLDGHPEAAVTTILLAEGADPHAVRPVLAYQCAIDAVTDRGFPSYVLQRGAKTRGSIVPFELLFIGVALSKGWAVTVADHEGIDGRFGAPREPGFRVLDGIRATLAHLDLPRNTAAAAWGYSGGGMATSWVVEMAADYAPDVNLVGAVLGAPVGDPGEVYARLNGSFHTGLAVLVIAALRHRMPALRAMVLSHSTPRGRRQLEIADRMTTVGAVLRFMWNRIDNYTDEPMNKLLAEPEMLAFFDELRLGMNKPSCPVLMIQPIYDQIVQSWDVDNQASRYIDAGGDVTYIRDRLSEHITGLPFSVPLSMNWLADRFEGRATSPEVRTVWSMTASSGFPLFGVTIARMLLGKRNCCPEAAAPVTLRAGSSTPRSGQGEHRRNQHQAHEDCVDDHADTQSDTQRAHGSKSGGGERREHERDDDGRAHDDGR